MMSVILIAVIAFLLTIIGVLWANGIENMRDEYPEYKGDDFLN
jgi:hypothetical protein